MEIRYNVTGAKRKELVKVIADTTGARAEYKFMPTCNYEIDYFTVTKDGTLLFDDRADSEEVERVLESIAAAGFECEPQEKAAECVFLVIHRLFGRRHSLGISAHLAKCGNKVGVGG